MQSTTVREAGVVPENTITSPQNNEGVRGADGPSQTSNTSVIINPRINYGHRTIVKSGIGNQLI